MLWYAFNFLWALGLDLFALGLVTPHICIANMGLFPDKKLHRVFRGHLYISGSRSNKAKKRCLKRSWRLKHLSTVPLQSLHDLMVAQVCGFFFFALGASCSCLQILFWQTNMPDVEKKTIQSNPNWNVLSTVPRGVYSVLPLFSISPHL